MYSAHTHVLSHKHTNTHLHSVQFTVQQRLLHNKVAQIGSCYTSRSHVDVCVFLHYCLSDISEQSVIVDLGPAAGGGWDVWTAREGEGVYRAI